MTDKYTKDMTASELLRWAANGEPYNGVDGKIWTYPEGKMRAIINTVTGELPSDYELFSIIANKIDAELAQARELSLRQGAKLWAMANGWPDFKEWEDFGAWLDRCAFPKPMDDHGEPVQLGEHIDDKVRGDIDVSRISYTANGHYFNNSHNSVGARIAKRITYAPGERVKRPAPEALGADGKPIKVGETVWMTDEGNAHVGSVDFKAGPRSYGLFCVEVGEPLTVLEIKPKVRGNDHRFVVFDHRSEPWCDASWLTHTPPDTKELIDRDAALPAREYYARHIGHDVGLKDDAEVTEAMVLDLLRRQRELDKRTGGAE